MEKFTSIQEPPVGISETERQYFFMELAKKKLKEKEAEIGHPLTFCVTTFGCQMNARDSEKLEGILETRRHGRCHQEVFQLISIKEFYSYEYSGYRRCRLYRFPYLR